MSAVGKRKAMSASAKAGINFTNWHHTGTIDIRVYKGPGTRNRANEEEKKDYLEFHQIQPGARASKIAKTTNGGSAPDARTARALGFKNLKHVKESIKKVEKLVDVFPGLRYATAGKLLTAALRNALSHFSDSSVRQSYSGSIFETTSFAVAAHEKNVNVIYFEDWDGDISKIYKHPRTFILKSEFSLDNTIKSNKEFDPKLQSVWRTIIGLAARSTNNPNMQSWKENERSKYKGFKDVQPDVLEWKPPSTTHPTGTIRIYELKVGEGKPEAIPAEAFQLVKAKRAIELTLISKGVPANELPHFELYFLPWMFGTPENKKPKFVNYKTHPHGRDVWAILKDKDSDGYNITELSRDSFAHKTGLSAELITLTLEMLREEQGDKLLKILQHIKRHSLVYSGTSHNTRARALRVFKSKPKAHPKHRPQYERLLGRLQRKLPGKRNQALPPGTNNLAHWMEHGAPEKSAEANRILMRAVSRMASMPTSKYAIYSQYNGKKLSPVVNSPLVSNNENTPTRNAKHMARISAARKRPEALTHAGRLLLRNVTVREKNEANKLLSKYVGLKPAIANGRLPLMSVYAKLREDHLPPNVGPLKEAFKRLQTSTTLNEINKRVLGGWPKNLK